MLVQTVANTLAQPGHWRVESQTDYNAILVKGKPVNHVLHLILSIVTFGLRPHRMDRQVCGREPLS